MSGIADRVVCPECNAIRVRTSKRYCFCPNGHGRLVKAFTLRQAFIATFPEAHCTGSRKGRNTYEIDGVEGVFLLAGRAVMGEPSNSDEVLAKTIASSQVELPRRFYPNG